MTKIIYELIGDPEPHVMSFDDFNDAGAAYVHYHAHEGTAKLWVFEGARDECGNSVCGAIKRELIKSVFLVESEDEGDKPDFAKSFYIGMNKHLEEKVKRLSDESVRLKKEVSELESELLHKKGECNNLVSVNESLEEELTRANTVIEEHKTLAAYARVAFSLYSHSSMARTLAVDSLGRIISGGGNS